MSTRGLTIVRSRWNESQFENDAVIYRHHDSYPEEHGKTLCDFLQGLELINGIPSDPPGRFANGPGRLAAQLVCHLQSAGHDSSLQLSTDPCGQEFEYYINCDMNRLSISIEVYTGPVMAFGCGGGKCKKQIFTGTVQGFTNWVNSIPGAKP